MSVIETAEHGYFGGYLIVSSLGRPIEFHCTAPVRPSPAQRILYGPTLEPYLLGEQIAGTLLDAAKSIPALILANCEAALHIRPRSRAPMAYLSPAETHPTGAIATVESVNTDDASSGAAGAERTCAAGDMVRTFDSTTVHLPVGYESERDQVTKLLRELARHVSVDEPFGRIEEAIREAQRLGSSEHHDQAA